MPALGDIRAAREKIAGEIVYTPCTRSLVFEDLVSCELYFKFENLQRTGSFKERGALNKLLSLSPEERARGVITSSAGNHAQAVAYHASRLGVRATVVMPETTPLVKISNTRRYGAEVILHGTNFSEAYQEVTRRLSPGGAVLIHAFNDEVVIAGQGTIALELLEQLPELDVVIVPVGGGGLISGIALGLKSLKPSVRVIGVEAAAAPAARAARDAGRIVPIESLETIAEGVAVKSVGELTFPLLERYVDDLVVVGEEEIATAILLLLEREKTMVEGAGATTLAALLSGRVRVKPGDRVVLVLSGGNIDVNMLSRIIARGLVADGRLAAMIVRAKDRPGSLAKLTAIIAKHGANVLEISHRRAFADISASDVDIGIIVEARGREHVREIVAALEAAGHTVRLEL